MNFYDKILKKLLAEKIISQNETVLFVGGRESDRNTFFENGFQNVIITNLEFDRGVNDYFPYEWEFQDMEGLSYEDESFY